MSLPIFLREYPAQVEACISRYLPLATPQTNALAEAMRYSVLGGGKRIRALLALTTAQACGGTITGALPIAAAIECLHAYSLVHDDLPAMDDDALRRGKPTCHLAYNEATAILVGDALQALAFEIIADPELDIATDKQLKMVQLLARASGCQGMVHGQVLDLMYEKQTISLHELETMHLAKTGALIQASVLLGAMSAPHFDLAASEPLTHFAHHLGLAFQIQDDILDVTETTETLGKPAKSDEHNQKSTYPSLLGLDAAQLKATHHAEQALSALKQLPFETEHLKRLARYIVERNT